MQAERPMRKLVAYIGISRLLDEALRRISSVQAVPAGGWLVSAVDDAGQAILLKIADNGDTVDRVVLTPAPPCGGGLLEVWVACLARQLCPGRRRSRDHRWIGAPVGGAQSLVPLRVTDSRLVVGKTQRVFHGSDDADPNVDILIVVTDDQAHVGRLEPGQTTDRSGTTITSSADGRLWHVTFDATAVTIRETPLSTTDRDR